MPRPGRPPASCRLLVVQWGGDYREAYRRLSSGGDETYHAQRYSVASIGEIGRGIEQAGVLCCFCDEGYDEVMGNGVRTMGAGLSGPGADFGPVLHLIERFRPTHLIVNTPREDLIGGALAHDVAVLPLLAYTFQVVTAWLSAPRKLVRIWRQRRYRRRLAGMLNDSHIRWVANHNLNACRQLVKMGVAARKVVPWDWPPTYRPGMFSPKSPPAGDRPWRLVFAVTTQRSAGGSTRARRH